MTSPTECAGKKLLSKRARNQLLRLASLLDSGAKAIRRYVAARTPRRGKR